MNEIIVSVVMPVYNEEKYLEKCIRSLLAQDYPKENMEWIFVDGGSKDKTLEILDGFLNEYPNTCSKSDSLLFLPFSSIPLHLPFV